MHQGSFQSLRMAPNSSQKNSLYLFIVGPYTPEKIHPKLSSQFLNRQEMEKRPTSILTSSNTLLSHKITTPPTALLAFKAPHSKNLPTPRLHTTPKDISVILVSCRQTKSTFWELIKALIIFLLFLSFTPRTFQDKILIFI